MYLNLSTCKIYTELNSDGWLYIYMYAYHMSYDNLNNILKHTWWGIESTTLRLGRFQRKWKLIEGMDIRTSGSKETWAQSQQTVFEISMVQDPVSPHCSHPEKQWHNWQSTTCWDVSYQFEVKYHPTKWKGWSIILQRVIARIVSGDPVRPLIKKVISSYIIYNRIIDHRSYCNIYYTYYIYSSI